MPSRLSFILYLLGHMPSDLVDVPLDWKCGVPYTLDSNQRISYQQPNQPAALANKTDRFGHSADDRHKLLVGVGTLANLLHIVLSLCIINCYNSIYSNSGIYNTCINYNHSCCYHCFNIYHLYSSIRNKRTKCVANFGLYTVNSRLTVKSALNVASS